MSYELFKLFSAPMPEGSRIFTINMDVEQGTLILLDKRGNIVEKSDTGLLWCQAPETLGRMLLNWFNRGVLVESGWAYPATVSGPEALGFFIQGCARLAERMSRT